MSLLDIFSQLDPQFLGPSYVGQTRVVKALPSAPAKDVILFKTLPVMSAACVMLFLPC